MFTSCHLPKIIQFKGEGAFIDLQRTHVVGFINDEVNLNHQIGNSVFIYKVIHF